MQEDTSSAQSNVIHLTGETQVVATDAFKEKVVECGFNSWSVFVAEFIRSEVNGEKTENFGKKGRFRPSSELIAKYQSQLTVPFDLAKEMRKVHLYHVNGENFSEKQQLAWKECESKRGRTSNTVVLFATHPMRQSVVLLLDIINPAHADEKKNIENLINDETVVESVLIVLVEALNMQYMTDEKAD